MLVFANSVMYLVWCVLDLLGQVLIVDDLGQYFLKGVRLAEELLHVLLGLPRHQRRVLIILFNTLPRLDILRQDHLTDLLRLCLNDLWLDGGFQVSFKVGIRLQIYVGGATNNIKAGFIFKFKKLTVIEKLQFCKEKKQHQHTQSLSVNLFEDVEDVLTLTKYKP